MVTHSRYTCLVGQGDRVTEPALIINHCVSVCACACASVFVCVIVRVCGSLSGFESGFK